MTTEPSHMLKWHQKRQQWTPGRLKNWVHDIDSETLRWIGTQQSDLRCQIVVNSRARVPTWTEVCTLIGRNKQGLVLVDIDE